jgi:hypothetical protein
VGAQVGTATSSIAAPAVRIDAVDTFVELLAQVGPGGAPRRSGR